MFHATPLEGPVQDDIPPAPYTPRAMRGYGLPWLRLQQGYAHELAFRALLTRLAVRLSGTAKLNHYIPSLDVSETDVLMVLQTPAWTIPIHVSVKSSCRAFLRLGPPNTPGTLHAWFKRVSAHQLPSLVIFGVDGKLVSMTPRDIRRLSGNRNSVKIALPEDNGEEGLCRLLTAIAELPSESAARQLLL